MAGCRHTHLSKCSLLISLALSHCLLSWHEELSNVGIIVSGRTSSSKSINFNLVIYENKHAEHCSKHSHMPFLQNILWMKIRILPGTVKMLSIFLHANNSPFKNTAICIFSIIPSKRIVFCEVQYLKQSQRGVTRPESHTVV